jgi:putative oxidoreductase
MLAGHGLDLALLMLRVAAEASCCRTLGKLFGWFGGPGRPAFATELRGFGLPAAAPLPLLLALTQVLSGLAVLLGWQTRVAALAAAAFIGFTVLLALPRAGSGCAAARVPVDVDGGTAGPRWPGPAPGHWTANAFREIS